jgi:predicted transcriptional regulator
MYSFLTPNVTLITLVVIPFLTGMLSIVLFFMLRGVKDYIFNTDKESINSLVSNYLAKSRYFERELAQLYVRIDEIESRLNKEFNSGSNKIIGVASTANDNVDITSHNHDMRIDSQNHVVTGEQNKSIMISRSSLGGHNDITQDVLNLLIQKPVTAKELQYIIARSREHTSRLLKKLYESKLLYRDFSARPFKYSITEEGRRWLSERSQINEKKSMANDPGSAKFEISSKI